MATFPDDAIQNVIDHWWVKDESKTLRRGRLVWTIIPFAGQIPHELVPEGRDNARDHARAQVRLEQHHVGRTRPPPKLPVAALPRHPGEVYLAFKGKKRPALILGEEPPSAAEHLGKGSPKTHRTSPVLVAPYFGADQSGSRSGFPEEFVKRVRRGEYPQYIWDQLPVGASTNESVLRLDHIQPIGRSAAVYEWTPHCLAAEALPVLDAWVTWLLGGKLDADSELGFIREELRSWD